MRLPISMLLATCLATSTRAAAPSTQPLAQTPDDPVLDSLDDPGAAQAAIQLRALNIGHPLAVPVPGLGFYLYCVHPIRKWVQLDDQFGHAIQVNVGDEVQKSGWVVAETGFTKDLGCDSYAVFRNKTDGTTVTLYEHVRYPIPGFVTRMPWNSWLRHQNEPLAVRLRAQHKLILFNKPHGEPDDDDPLLHR